LFLFSRQLLETVQPLRIIAASIVVLAMHAYPPRETLYFHLHLPRCSEFLHESFGKMPKQTSAGRNKFRFCSR
jgi:hypothetical protein